MSAMNCELCGVRADEAPVREGEDDVRWCQACLAKVHKTAAMLLGEPEPPPADDKPTEITASPVYMLGFIWEVG